MDSGRIRKLFLLFSLFFHDSTLGSLQPLSPGGLSSVLVLDIDGTVYDDECQIEQQIRDNCHIFASTFGYSASDSEDMHNKFGSTIRGICEYGQPRIKFLDYYNDVYPHLDMSLLRKYSSVTSEGNTGYNIAMGGALNSLHRLDCPIVVASNSPIFHVKRVLTRLGLSQLKVAAFITPERRSGITKNEPKFWDPLFQLYPQDRFLCTLVDDNGLNVKLVRELGMRALRITADFSLPEALVHFMNLLRPHPSESGPTAILPGRNVPDFVFNEISYLEAKNEIDVKSYNPAVQATVLHHLKQRIQHRFPGIASTKRSPLVAVDLGAGLLNMLPTVQKLFSDAVTASTLGTLELQYVAFESNKNIRRRTVEILANKGFVSIPSSVDLTAATASTIRSDVQSFKGTMTAHGDKSTPMTVTVHLVSEDFMTDAAVKILKDLLESHRCEGSISTAAASSSMYTRVRPSVDLFIGCCVADLIPPTELVSQVVEMAGDNGGLLYLPITFCGETKLVRGMTCTSQDSRPLPHSSNAGLPVPTDCEVFDVYRQHLESRGHYIGIDRLVSTLGAYGCTVVTPADSSAGSDWRISRANNPYMWSCMMRFVALGTAFEMLGKFDLKSWFDGLTFDESEKGEGQGEGAGNVPDVEIVASNIDILAVLPEIVQRILSPTEMMDSAASEESIYCTDFSSPPAEALRATPKISRLSSSLPQPLHPALNIKKQQLAIPSIRRSVEFLSPGNVHIVEEAVPKVGVNQLLIRTSCSLVSTGTELKVFKGDLDPDEPADLTIDSLKEKMSYPLRFGYSLVGEVVAVGDGVDEADWLGKLVFSFSPHSSAVVIDVSSAMLVPEGIAPEDAVFLPSVETAVSFVQAARPNIGEKALVVGQGLIGMLTGAVMTHLANADTTIADVSEKRLAAASYFNTKATPWNPTAPRSKDPAFDLTVEVSGHPGGLQTAIDNTGSHGRIVIGSWYGEKPTQVKLGLRFHRSGIQLITSQVSNIPPELTGRWDKKRRFDLTWDTIRLIKPSRLISSVSAFRSEDVLAAYIRLEKGEDVTVLFKDDL